MKKLNFVLSALLCLSALHMGEAQSAAPTFSQALATGKQSVKAGNYVAAEKEAQESLMLAKSPEDQGNALIFLGETFYKRKMYEQARSLWSKVGALNNPDGELESRAHIAIASSYLAEGNSSKAIAEYKTAIASIDVKPNLSEEDKQDAKFALSFLLADAYYETRQLALARQQYAQLLNTSKDDVDSLSTILFRLGQINFRQKNLAGALKHFSRLSNLQGADLTLKKYAQAQIKLLTSSTSSEEKVKEFNRDLELGDAATTAYSEDF